MKNGKVKNGTAFKGMAVGKNCDIRGTAYVTEAAAPFKGNGVSSTAVMGGDLRSKSGK